MNKKLVFLFFVGASNWMFGFQSLNPNIFCILKNQAYHLKLLNRPLMHYYTSAKTEKRKNLFSTERHSFSSSYQYQGPIAGAIAYWATKSLCYGTAIAGATTAVVATGGVAGAATGALVAGVTASAGTGATVVGGAIAGAGLAGDAAVIAAGATAAAGGALEVVAAVETASVAAGSFFTLLPFLP